MDYPTFCQHWLQAWTGNQPEHLRSFYAADAFYRDPARPQGVRGSELLPYFQKLLARNPNWRWKILEIMATANGFCLKWAAEIPVNQTVVKETGLDIVEIKEGKITRNEVYFDRVALMKELNSKS